MKRVINVLIIILIIIENSIYKMYPHNMIAISYFAFINYKDKKLALFYAFIIPIIIGITELNLIFFVLLYYVITQFYKYAEYKFTNLIIISLIEVILYTLYIYFFQIQEIMFFEILKQILGVILFCVGFYNIDKRFAI